MWSQVLGTVWFFLALAMLAGVALGIVWQRLDKKPTTSSEEIGILKTKLKATREECDSCTESRQELEARVGDLEKSLVSSKSRAAELEVRMRIMEAEKTERAATPTTVPVEAATEVPADAEPTGEEPAPVQEKAASTEGSAWASLARSMENDTLEDIHGIGPRLALLLHELGIHTFRQVALWNDTDIERIEEKLPEFRGRIRRENWMQSAKECHWRKYSEAIGGYAPTIES